MSTFADQAEELNYEEYRFGRSRQVFRGPMPDLSRPYIACIGGSETYGRFSPVTYAQQMQRSLGIQCVNWGTPGAGPGFFLKDSVLLESCSRARACVVAVMSAHAMPNRYYRVFFRRNERLRDVSEMLATLYPEVDFGRFRYVGNMLNHLYEVSPDRFAMIRLELKNAWIARMTELMNDIETPKVLVWFSNITPDESDMLEPRAARHVSPAYVTSEMVEAVKPFADFYVEFVADPEAVKGAPGDRVLGDRSENVARRFPSATMHKQLAELLDGPVSELLATSPAGPNDTSRPGWGGLW